MSGVDNLIPFNERTEEEQRAIATSGGIASGEARRKKKAMRDQIELLLSLPLKESKLSDSLANMGVDTENIDNQMALVLSMYIKACSGEPGAVEAAKFLRDTVGEKLPERVNVTNVEGTIGEVEKYLHKKIGFEANED